MKPYVTIELQPYLQDYLRHEFGAQRKSDDAGLQITCVNDIGKMIMAMVTITDRPPKTTLKEHPITLYLPIQEWNHYILAENFVYIPEWKQQQLTLFIEASFRLRIREYFLIGYQKGFKQDRIINAFLTAYNIKANALSYDAVKKYDYRNRQKVTQQINKEIQLELWG